MNLNYHYILYLSDIVWLFPVLRQRKTKYFYLFLMYALTGPLGYLTYFLITPNMYFVTITLSYITFLSIFEFALLKGQWIYFLGIYCLFVVAYVNFTNWQYQSIILAVLWIATILMLSHHFIISLLELKFNSFVLLLISYLFLQVLQVFLIVAFEYKYISNYMYFTDLFEILVGIFFIIFRADDDRLFIRL